MGEFSDELLGYKFVLKIENKDDLKPYEFGGNEKTNIIFLCHDCHKIYNRKD